MSCIRGSGILHSITFAVGHDLVKFPIETFRRRSRIYLDPPFLPASLGGDLALRGRVSRIFKPRDVL